MSNNEQPKLTAADILAIQQRIETCLPGGGSGTLSKVSLRRDLNAIIDAALAGLAAQEQLAAKDAEIAKIWQRESEGVAIFDKLLAEEREAVRQRNLTIQDCGRRVVEAEQQRDAALAAQKAAAERLAAVMGKVTALSCENPPRSCDGWQWWRTRADAIASLMGWTRHSYDPGFCFRTKSGASVEVDMDVAQKLLDLAAMRDALGSNQ